jgi:hypothetical protein
MVERSGRIQAQRAKHKQGSKEFERLTKSDLKILAEGLAKALALNPKPRAKKKHTLGHMKLKRTLPYT